MGFSALPRYGCFVPVWVYCGTFRRDIYPIRAKKVTFADEKSHTANPVCAHDGWCPARLGRGGYGARVGKGRELVDPPRVRMGEPGLAALDSLLQRTLPLRALR